MKHLRIFSPILLLALMSFHRPAITYKTNSGQVKFHSNAPMENIAASSAKLKGLVSPESKGFAFSVEMPSFEGFNSPLQKEHFNENYIESKRFPKATFEGKVIENIDFITTGEYDVRAKGTFEIHGMKQEKIVRGKIKVAPNQISILCNFTIKLSDYGIAVPRIVRQKISEEVDVTVDCLLNKI